MPSMPIVLLLTSAGFVTACTTEQAGTSVTLANFDTSTVTIYTQVGSSPASATGLAPVRVLIDGPVTSSDPAPTDCVTIQGDVHASFNGSRMELVNRGGYASDFGLGNCESVEFQLVDLPATPAAISTVEIADDTTTWSVSAEDVLTDDVALQTPTVRGQPLTVTWTNASMFDIAQATLASGAGLANVQQALGPAYPSENTLTVDTSQATSGPATMNVRVRRFPKATACVGPGSCAAEADVNADFSFALP